MQYRSIALQKDRKGIFVDCSVLLEAHPVEPQISRNSRIQRLSWLSYVDNCFWAMYKLQAYNLSCIFHRNRFVYRIYAFQFEISQRKYFLLFRDKFNNAMGIYYIRYTMHAVWSSSINRCIFLRDQKMLNLRYVEKLRFFCFFGSFLVGGVERKWPILNLLFLHRQRNHLQELLHLRKHAIVTAVVYRVSHWRQWNSWGMRLRPADMNDALGIEKKEKKSTTTEKPSPKGGCPLCHKKILMFRLRSIQCDNCKKRFCSKCCPKDNRGNLTNDEGDVIKKDARFCLTCKPMNLVHI